MTEHILEAYRVDIDTRTNPNGNQREFPEGYGVNAHETSAGIVYKDANVTVTAFPTKHAMESYGFRFDTPDRSIVISGDTSPTEALIESCHGCDVLIHEANSVAFLAKWREFQLMPRNITPRRHNSRNSPVRQNPVYWLSTTPRLPFVQQ